MKRMKKYCALLLSVAMVLAFLPVYAMAEDDAEPVNGEETVEAVLEEAPEAEVPEEAVPEEVPEVIVEESGEEIPVEEEVPAPAEVITDTEEEAAPVPEAKEGDSIPLTPGVVMTGMLDEASDARTQTYRFTIGDGSPCYRVFIFNESSGGSNNKMRVEDIYETVNYDHTGDDTWFTPGQTYISGQLTEDQDETFYITIGCYSGGSVSYAICVVEDDYSLTSQGRMIKSIPRNVSKWSAAGSACLYTGSARTPAVAVKYNGVSPSVDIRGLVNKNYWKNNLFYKVTYSNNVNVGKGKIVVTGKAPFSGSLTRYFDIIPKYTQIKTLKSPARRRVAISWYPQKVQTSGYQIQYSTNKNFTSGVKTISIGYNTVTSRTITGLTSGKYYYFRVRTYKYIGKNSLGNSMYEYSGWSTTKYVRVK